MSHHTINGLIAGMAVVFASVIISAILFGPEASSGNDDHAPSPVDLSSEPRSDLGVGGAPADEGSEKLATESGTVVDSETGEPLSGVTVIAESEGAEIGSTTTGDDGHFELENVPTGSDLIVTVEGYHTVEQAADGDDDYEIALESSLITGRVFGTDGSPIPDATVASGGNHARTDGQGGFELDDTSGEGDIIAKAAGFETKVVAREEYRRGFTLKPKSVRGVYASADSVSDENRFTGILDMVDRTELNAVVVDLKDSTGSIHYDSQVPLANEIDAVEPAFDAGQIVQQIKERDVYAIARIAVFADPVLAGERPDLAVMDAESEELWTTWQGSPWANPYREAVWDYNIELMREAVELGFDEIQLTAVRFPTNGPLNRADYGQESTAETSRQAVNDFLDLAYDTVGATTASLGADVSSTTLVDGSNEEFGQELSTMAERLDYVYPTLYPSDFPEGTFGLEMPGDHPYDVIQQSLASGMEHIPSHYQARIRPWLQDFSYGSAMRFADAEVRDEINATNESGASGWLLWNAENYYHESALEPAE